MLLQPEIRPISQEQPVNEVKGIYADLVVAEKKSPRPISQEQLVNEVKSIYAGLVMVEKKCVEVYLPLALVLYIAYRYFLCRSTNNRAPLLTSYRMNSSKLIALHRTLLHENHDFFLASQHPTFITYSSSSSYKVCDASPDMETRHSQLSGAPQTSATRLT
jgi:hypothetical protein